ncbi:MAG: protein kinase, partial [Gammaproteobacteria bacterium]|nr:protein kinase [Gammaproteobacteria bacterium]
MTEEKEQILERRRSPQSGEKKKDKSFASYNSESFKHLLLKYCQRQRREEKVFSLCSISILEYETVLTNLGVHAAKQLHHLALAICQESVRDLDKLCIIKEGSYLLLLPDAESKQAQVILERINKALASTKRDYHHQPLRATCASLITDSRQTAGDPEAMLKELNYQIDTDGAISADAQQIHLKLPVKQNSLASGFTTIRMTPHLVAWLERYNQLEFVEKETGAIPSTQYKAIDTWKHQKDNQVCLKKVSFKTSGNTPLLLKRLRTLQAMDHPNVRKIIDFCLDDEESLYLVMQQIKGLSLSELIAKGSLTTVQILEQAISICTSLIYLQDIMPPLIPPPLTAEMFSTINDEHLSLIITNFEMPYLCSAYLDSTPGQTTGFIKIYE